MKEGLREPSLAGIIEANRMVCLGLDGCLCMYISLLPTQKNAQDSVTEWLR